MSHAEDTFGSPSTASPSHNLTMLQIFKKYKIDDQKFFYFEKLKEFNVVVLCDDSTSMGHKLKHGTETRWYRLKKMVSIVVELMAALDPNGINIHFLNRDPLLIVTDPTKLQTVFDKPPEGSTPIVPALRKILNEKRNGKSDKNLLILIATDGVPTNEKNEPDPDELEKVLIDERDRHTNVTFLSCTDDVDTIEYQKKWDKKIPNVDVVDDYETELEQVKKAHGQNFPFSEGVYACKVLLGSINSWFDSLDEED